jgi:hypothetical protein
VNNVKVRVDKGKYLVPLVWRFPRPLFWFRLDDARKGSDIRTYPSSLIGVSRNHLLWKRWWHCIRGELCECVNK